MDKHISEIYNAIQEITWHFGDHGINEECCEGLSFVEFMALKKIYENETISVQEIGNKLRFTKSGATKIINRLESKCCVKKNVSPLDGRVCCLSATDKGEAVVAGAVNKYTAYLENVLQGMESEEIRKIEAALKVLTAALNKNI